jgi:hypothetical protein
MNKTNYNHRALIVDSSVLEIDDVSDMGYKMPELQWLDVVIKLKSDIPPNLIDAQIIYILKDGDLFHIKPSSITIEDNRLTIKPKSCGLLIQNINKTTDQSVI